MPGTFDTRSNFLNEGIPDTWEPAVRANHWENRLAVVNGLRVQYGEADLPTKLAEFALLGPEPFSILAYHNRFFRQARDAFVIGANTEFIWRAC